MSNTRIHVYRIQELVRLHRMGEAKGEVARLLGLSPTTERAYRRALAEAGLLEGDPGELPEEEQLQAVVQGLSKEARQQRSSIADWEADVLRLLKADVSARAIHGKLSDEAREAGREFGSYDAVKRMVRRLRPQLEPKPGDVTIRIHTDPGESAQVDFGYVGRVLDPQTGKLRRAWVFVMVLGYSRHMFARVVFDQKAETWLRLHVEAFEALGGVPAVIVPDNLKSAVIRAAFGESEAPELNRSYVELARHYDFKIDPTPPRDPQKKGKVESGVKYVRSNFVKPRKQELASTPCSELNRALDRWVYETAGLRTHGTTREQPRLVFEREERAALKPLPHARYELAVWSRVKVLRDSHVRVHGAYYSVPYAHLARQVSVRTTRHSVTVHLEAKRIATHARVRAGAWSTDEAHLPAERAALARRSEGYWRERAAELGAKSACWVAELLEGDGVLSRVNEAQRAVLLLEGVTRERAEAACDRARHFGNYTAKALKRILKQELDREPLPTPQVAPTPSAPCRHARTPEEVAQWARAATHRVRAREAQ